MKAILIDDEARRYTHPQEAAGMETARSRDRRYLSGYRQWQGKVEDISPDVVFLDIRMPGKNGLEMLTEITDRNFEVIFVTAHNEYMLQALQFSAVDYLMKPVDEDRLGRAVDRVGRRLRQENAPSRPKR